MPEQLFASLLRQRAVGQIRQTSEPERLIEPAEA
jgi:hypothetical protein